MGTIGKPSGIRLESGEEIRVKDADFLGEGGEGSVWRWKGMALKVALDEKAFAAKADKIRALAKIRHPGLITPAGLALGPSGAPVGYVMEIAKGEPLARYFSMAWQAQASVGKADIGKIAGSMREAALALHAAGAAGGDINEFNWSVDGHRATLFDCDSWGIGAYPVSAMMPSIADPLAKGIYRSESDWFALAILAFQLFAGAHPYRGRHPARGKGAWQERMSAGESLWDAGASFPPGARGLGWIPSGLGEWMREVLAHRAREAMPDPALWSRKAGKSAAPKPAAQTAAGLVRSAKAFALEEIALPEMAIGWLGEGAIALAGGGAWDLASGQRMAPAHPKAKLLRSADGEAVWIWEEGDRLKASAESGAHAEIRLAAGEEIRLLGGRAFAFGAAGWREIEIRKIGGRLAALPCAQGILAGRPLGGESDATARLALGGMALLRASEKRCGGLSSIWEKPKPGEFAWGAKHAGGGWAIGRRDGSGASWWDISDAAGNRLRLEADLSGFERGPSGWVAIASGEAFWIRDGKAEALDWPGHWVAAKGWAGSLWALAGNKAIRVGLC